MICEHCAAQAGNSKGCFCKTACGVQHCPAPPVRPIPPVPPPPGRATYIAGQTIDAATAARFNAEPIRSEEETRYHHPHRILPDPFQAILSGPALHPTQIRAQALMSAVTLYAYNVASNNNLMPADRPRLESSILDSAARFEAYIRGAR